MPDEKSYIIIIDFEGEFVCADNQYLAKAFSKKYDKNLLNFVSPAFKEEVVDALLSVKDDETIHWNQKLNPFLYRFKYLPVSFSPIYDETGKTKHVLLKLEELKKEKDETVEINENKFESLFNHANDAIFVTDIEGNFIEVNELAIKRTGFSKSQFLALNIKNTPVKREDQAFINYFQEILLYGESTSQINYLHRKGHIVETEISGKKLRYNGQEAILHISREISVRNKTYSNSIDILLQKEEKERSAFAHQINDVVGANLSMLKMYIESYFKINDGKERNRIAEKIRLIIDNSLGIITELSNKISPHVLKNLGLKIALEVFIKKIQKSSEINFIFKLDIPEKISEEVSIIIYRSIIEVVDNIVKHSRAKKAGIFAYVKNDSMIFEINDDGIGFVIEEAFADKKNIGVLNVLNKIKSINGIIDYLSEQGKGTRVKIEIPINEQKN